MKPNVRITAGLYEGQEGALIGYNKKNERCYVDFRGRKNKMTYAQQVKLMYSDTYPFQKTMYVFSARDLAFKEDTVEDML